MAKINFIKEKNRASIEVPDGTNLMQALTQNGVPVASSCFGKGICSKCRIRVINGPENLSPENETIAGLRERNRISNDYRISCHTEVLGGEITIDTSYW